jgi:ubiquitin-like 1-activating enzyme E1 B
MMAGLRECYGAAVVDRIRTEGRVLVVGAGGIGCELLKNLALCGFRRATAIDLDTIDVSNLNRQLLFRSSHVGRPKSVVACQVAADSLVPGDRPESKDEDGAPSAPSSPPPCLYEAVHGNVCDSSVFDAPFVSRFDVVLNALDNVAARRRVNRLCLAARGGEGVPMVEAGTTGYLGQASVVTRAVQCYECRPQEAPKVYPICTIRSTPTLPVHAIVWAKELYKLLFHPKVEESMLYEAVDGEDEAGGGEDEEEGEGGGGSREPSTYMRAVLDYRGALARASGAEAVAQDGDADGKGVEGMARDVLRRLYGDEIQKQLGMGRYKAARKTPAPLDVEELLPAGGGGGEGGGGGGGSANAAGSRRHDQVWTRGQCAREFVRCLADAAALLASSSPSPSSSSSSERGGGAPARVLLPEFDKDDDLGMRLVTAAANLRSYAFGIEPIQSYYSAKVRERQRAGGRRGRKITERERENVFFSPVLACPTSSFSSPALLPACFRGSRGTSFRRYALLSSSNRRVRA